MVEKGFFQRGIDRAINYSRSHKGETTSEVLFVGGVLAAGGSRPDLAATALIAGAIIGIGSGISRYGTMLSEGMRRAEYIPEPTIPQQSVLADFTEEGPAPS